MRQARGFTLLEVLLATVLGTMVVAAGIAVMSSMTRVDRTLTIRSQTTTELATTHVLLQKMFRSIVLSDQTPEAEDPTDEEVEEEEASDDPFFDEVADRQDLEGITAPWERGVDESGDEVISAVDEDGEQIELPRFILRRDLNPELVRTAAALGFDGSMQSLEIVTREPPAGMRWPTLLTELEERAMQERIIATRGVLEIRPEEATGPLASKAPDGIIWSLWWRPLMPDGLPYPGDGEYRRDAYAIRLISGLVEYRWQVFFRERWLETYQVTSPIDMPAYVQLKVKTLSGMEAEWLFETGSEAGAEAVDPEASEIQPISSANRPDVGEDNEQEDSDNEPDGGGPST